MARFSITRRYSKIKNWIILYNNKRIKKSVYTGDLLNNELLAVGRYTYGTPEILIFPGEKSGKVLIGNYCSIAPDVKIFTGGNHRIDWVSTYPFNQFKNDFPEASKILGQPFSKGDVIIGNDVWIGQGAVILSGVKISDGAVIGAYTVVSKDVAPYAVVVGNPCKQIKKRFDEEIIKKLCVIKWWEWDISKIREEVGLLCSDNIVDFVNKYYNT